jgi:hypothetical protein
MMNKQSAPYFWSALNFYVTGIVLVESIENIEYEREPQMTDNFNFQCFVIHLSPAEIAQKNQENT